ncbi:ADOP family duplicated permease [Luteimonas saliphila]|uniref:ADOP family duplicated permease n=1 Tax=Luteimonas saliphila TaxID=2804919 RepID=UPI00192DBC54|nr:ADOP family duplicated permease [Luteimonas saliphila]
MTRADVLFAELGQAWRALLRRPGYFALASLTLALGVAAATSVFALLDRALLRPLPYPEPERLAMLGAEFVEGYASAAPGYRSALRRLDGVESMGLVAGFTRNSNVAVGDSAEVVPSLLADGGFLPTLGLPMALGRNFSDDEIQPNGPMAVILDHGFWRRQFGGDPSAIGSSLQVEGRAVAIVGVLPADLQWADRFDILLPLQAASTSTNMATNELLVARLSPGTRIEEMDAAIEPLLRAAYADQPGTSAEDLRWLENVGMGAKPLSNFFTLRAQTLWMFFAAAACVLLIAAINLGNLMLVRALSRSHAGAVRAALGAPRLRLAFPSMAEALLVGLCGAAAGLALAWAGLRLFGGLVPAEWMRGGEPGLTVASLAFALLCAVAFALLGALLGAWRGRARSLTSELSGGGRVGWSRGAGRLGRALVVAQVAVASLLLIGAGLFALSLHHLLSVPMGFESRHIVAFALSPVRESQPDLASTLEQTRRILEGFERLPGVEAATVANVAPTRGQFNMGFEFPDGRTVSTQYRLVGPGYADAIGLPLLSGRTLELADAAGREPVAVVNAQFARAYLNGDALGKTVRLSFDGAPPMRIVGVVGDTRQFGPAHPAPAILYAPFAQAPEQIWELVRGYIPLHYMVRLKPGAGVGEREIRAVVAQASPTQPISGVQTMEAVVAESTGEQKLNLLLVGLFAALALLLATVGLYAVMAVAVEARRHEFGVRAALGAPPGRLLRQVLREGMAQVALGLAIGLAAALSMSRLVQSLLFEVGAADPVAIGTVLVVLTTAGLLASLGPALRAARVPPMQALRAD